MSHDPEMHAWAELAEARRVECAALRQQLADLRAKNAGLRDALERISRMVCWQTVIEQPPKPDCKCFSCSARAALAISPAEHHQRIETEAERRGLERAAEIAHGRGVKYEAAFVASEGAERDKQLLARMGDCYLIERDIRAEAAKAARKHYGPDLGAFFRDVEAAKAGKEPK